jgi:molecular chaperone DnaK (HSP70)
MMEFLLELYFIVNARILGNNHLGGQDFNQRLVDFAVQYIRQNYPVLLDLYLKY